MLILRSLVKVVVTVVLASSLTFVVFATSMADTFAPGDTLAGLADFLRAMLLHGDLGYADYYDVPVTVMLRDGLPADLTMVVGGLGFGLVAGILGGLLAVTRPRTRLVRGLDLLAGLGVSLPVYWMGFVVLMLFAGNAGMIVKLPFVSGAATYETLPDDPLRFIGSLWVPCVVAGMPIAAGVYRMTVAAGREVEHEDYVRTAVAKGLTPRRVLGGHLLPVAALPVALFAAAQMNLLITNIALMQNAFNIPGSFREITRAFANSDLTLLQGMIVESCILIALANAAVDLLQARLDPRVG